MKYIFMLISVLFTMQCFSQNVDLIKKANLFEQDRGYVEKSGEEVDTEKVVDLPKNMPVLDGIIVIKDYKRAIFTYYDKDKRKRVSVYHSSGEKFCDAVLKKITPDYVLLYYGGKEYKLYPDTKLKAKNSHIKNTSYNVNTRVTPPPRRPVNKKTTKSRKFSRGRVRKPSRSFARKNSRVYTRRPNASRVKAVRRPSRTRTTTPGRSNVNHRSVNRPGNVSARPNPFTGGGRRNTPSPKKNTGNTRNTPF